MEDLQDLPVRKRKYLVPAILIIHFVLLLQMAPLLAQNNVFGLVTDRSTGELLVGATVYDTVSKRGTVTNEYGFYSLRTGAQKPVLQCSYVGYQPTWQSLQHIPDTTLNFRLVPSVQLEEVRVSALDASGKFTGPQMSFHNINRLRIKQLPALFGEVDLVKALQYLPGVSSGMEGTSGIYVRGGGSDQNLVLLDDVPVYNVNHLFGFFSVFNGEAVNSATIYKAGFPARYSGRLSSVIDIRMKEGNNQEFHGAASIGLISSDLTLEGPIIRDRTSFLVSARRTYLDIISYPVQYLLNLRDNNESYIGYYFQDFNAKINHKFSDRSRIYLSSYAGKDEFYTRDSHSLSFLSGSQTDTESYETRNGFNWGNFTSSLRWNYIWGNRFFSNMTFSYSNYRFTNFEEYHMNQIQLPDENGELTIVDDHYKWTQLYYSGIKDLSLRTDFSWKPTPEQSFRFGFKASRYLFEPGIQVHKGESDNYDLYFGPGVGDTVLATGITAYLEDEFSLGDRLKANIGLSSTTFNVEGKTYVSLEPRLAASFKLKDDLVLKASYAEMSQQVHLLTSATIGLPTDTWVPTTKNLAPERSFQFATGVHYRISPSLEFSWELFYKEMNNLVEYSEGAELMMNGKDWESNIETGEGTAYGAEFFLEKTSGKFTGSAAYTWSKNTRSFENIDNGAPFPYKYDRRHDLSLVANYQWKDHVSIGATWVLASGINTTIMDQSYQNPMQLIYPVFGERERYSQYDLIQNFENRNGYRMPPYHRLDLGINFTKEKKWFDRTWSFGIYNAYRRLNAMYLYSMQEKPAGSDQWQKRLYKVSLFPMIPYFRYSIKF